MASASKKSLLQQICQTLRAIANATTSLSSRRKIYKIYEIFVLAHVAKAIRNLGSTLQAMETVSGIGKVTARVQTTHVLNFRLSPRAIYHTGGSPGFLSFGRHGKDYELHNGVFASGWSQEHHELDVCVLSAQATDECRAKGWHPFGYFVRLLLECKHRSRYLEFGVSREVLGLIQEFPTSTVCLASNLSHGRVRSMLRIRKLRGGM